MFKKKVASDGFLLSIKDMLGTAARLLGTAINGVRRLASSLWRLEARLKGVQFDGTAVFFGRPIISVAEKSQLRLGDGAQLNSTLRSNPIGAFQPCVLRTMNSGARLVIAKNVGLSATVICAGLEVEIGEGTIVGSGAMILDNDFHRLTAQGWINESQSNAKPVKIGRNVFIGARVLILKGVTIGDGAMIGAGAVVTKDVPAGRLAIGNPARVIEPASV